MIAGVPPGARVAVLGAGLVGKTIVRDLAAEPALRVTAVDRDARALEGTGPAEAKVADLADPARVAAVAREVDLIVAAVPGHLGARVVRAAVEAGRPVVDISFSPEDPYALDDAARDAGVAVIPDCGVAPGLSNLLVGAAAAGFDRLDAARILVGGLPSRRDWPWEYRAVFSPSDVIEEYTRPSRYRRNGREVVAPAMSGTERIDLPEIGTVEAFDTDGLRTLLRNVDAPELREKTLRWPGHAEKIRVLRDTGFFSEETVTVGGVGVAPRRVSEALLARAWERSPDDEEFTVLRVEAHGVEGGRPARWAWDLLDRTDRTTGTTSMARTTAFPCAIVARFLLDGSWSEPGVHPPEDIGRDASLVERVLDGLARRGVRVRTERS